jgi:hypothetical protein
LVRVDFAFQDRLYQRLIARFARQDLGESEQQSYSQTIPFGKRVQAETFSVEQNQN